jgi:hypothetical protein
MKAPATPIGIATSRPAAFRPGLTILASEPSAIPNRIQIKEDIAFISPWDEIFYWRLNGFGDAQDQRACLDKFFSSSATTQLY